MYTQTLCSLNKTNGNTRKTQHIAMLGYNFWSEKVQWRVWLLSVGYTSGITAGAPKFWAVGKLSEILLLSESFHPKMQNLGLKSPIFGKLMGKIEILCTRNLLRRKFAAVCWKIKTSCRAYFSAQDAAGPHRHKMQWRGVAPPPPKF